MAKHKHDRMAVGNEDVEKSQIVFTLQRLREIRVVLILCSIDFLPSAYGLMLNASALTTTTTTTASYI